VSIINTIFIGVFSGLTTIFVLYIAKIILNKVLIPFYLKTTYKGIDLSGKWIANNENFTFTLEVKQAAHEIKGLLTINKHDSEGKQTALSSHYIKGEVWEGYMSLKTNAVDKRFSSFGTILLKIESGKLLQGFYTARKFNNDLDIGVIPTELEFVRNI